MSRVAPSCQRVPRGPACVPHNRYVGLIAHSQGRWRQGPRRGRWKVVQGRGQRFRGGSQAQASQEPLVSGVSVPSMRCVGSPGSPRRRARRRRRPLSNRKLVLVGATQGPANRRKLPHRRGLRLRARLRVRAGLAALAVVAPAHISAAHALWTSVTACSPLAHSPRNA